MTDQTFPQSALKPFKLKVTCLPLDDQMVAKLMESVFLTSFDFCLNDSEKFEDVLQKVFNQIKQFYESVQNMKIKV